METTTTTTKFLFRDHRDGDNSSVSGAGSNDVSSLHTRDDEDKDDDDDVEGQDDDDFQSMTAMGIMHLCSELMELKEESDEDFYRTIFSDYSVFIRIFEEVKVMEHEMSQLKSHVSDQRKLVDDLMNGLRENLSMDEINEPRDDEKCSDDDNEPIYMSELDAHVFEVLETLDILLVENRVDEALAIIENENENLRRMEEENECLPDTFRAIKSLILEMETTLELQLTAVAENPRISASELQTTLAYLKRLGNGSLVNRLLFKYYHQRIAAGTRRLERSSLLFHDGMYIRHLSKLIFSLISQATKGFEMLNGEDDSADARELITQWAKEETKAFAKVFSTYVKSISEINGGLSTAVQSTEFALSYCSLLGSRGVELSNQLIDGIRPCMEETLRIHVEHYKKVVGIFTASDDGILGKYLVSGILSGRDSTAAVGEYPEYCHLTNSGRKLVTLLQALTEDVSPLLVLRMRNPIFEGLKDLYLEYVAMSKEAVTCDRPRNEDPMADSPETLARRVSVLANVSALDGLFRRMIGSNFHGDGLDSCLSNVQEASEMLRSGFCRDFVSGVMSSRSDRLCYDERSSEGCGGPMMPSPPFQALFLELRKIERLSEEEVFKKRWVIELLREIVEAAFAWLQNMGTTSDNDDYDDNIIKQPRIQFAADLRFLVEIAKRGGYFSDNHSVLISFSNSMSLSADPDLQRDLVDGELGRDETAEAIRRLLEFEEEEENNNLLRTQGTSDSDGDVDESSIKESSSVIADDVNVMQEELQVSEDSEEQK